MRGLQWPGLTAFLVQFALGLCEPIPLFSDGEAKNPVAYLYNGVRLPGLPEWDKTVYPYACILHSTGFGLNNFYLRICPEPIYVAVNDTYGDIVYLPNNIKSWLSDETGIWEDFKSDTIYDQILSDTCRLVWCNVDIKKDGTVYLAASDPVPVYE